jgi:hypothetical protein
MGSSSNEYNGSLNDDKCIMQQQWIQGGGVGTGEGIYNTTWNVRVFVFSGICFTS